MFFGRFLPSSIKLRLEKKVQSSGRRLEQISDNRLLCQNTNTTNQTLIEKIILIGILYFTETMICKLSVTVYLFLELYGSTTLQS
jgi:hypothetical protein